MKTYIFAQRNAKEVLRDPINLFFGLGFPLILLALLSVINNSIPKEAGNTMFAIENLTPGLAMFGTVFMALFAGMLLSKDRASSFLMRLFASPMKSSNFILGYTLPILAVSVVQIAITILASSLFGFSLSLYVFPAIIVAALNSLLFVGFGLFVGSIFNEKSVGGLCGALFTNLAGWFSGIFIPLDLVGGAFKTAADIMPFYHSVESTKAIFAGDFVGAMHHIAVVLGYTVVIYLLAIIFFRRKMKGDGY
ncbi:MAG: ABC transporter permease [Oscillospiraceae bacterium]